MDAASLKVRIGGDDSAAIKALKNVDRQVERTADEGGRHLGRFSGVISGLGGVFGTLGKAAGAVALGGIAAAGAGFGAAAFQSLKFNSSMEVVSAQLMAFTKDGKATADILDMIKDRASRTPFAFEEMAKAATALLPAAKASGKGLEDLIGIAEILAASNPAQGLEGAAFSLKEALSGDFTSIIERFNLPRQRLKELRAEGVPDIEAVQIAMKELGLDASLVGNLAATVTGRWSTFKDSLTNIAAVATKPLFEGMSKGLGDLQTKIDANMPKMEAFATVIGEKLGSAFSWLIETGVPSAIGAWNTLSGAFSSAQSAIQPLIDAFGEGGIGGALALLRDRLLAWASETLPGWLESLGQLGMSLGQWVVDALPGVIENLISARDQMLAWVTDSLPGWLEALGQFGATMGQWALDAIPLVLEQLGTLAQAMITQTMEYVPQWIATFAEYGIAAVSWIAEALPGLIDNLGQFASTMINWVVEQLPGWATQLGQLGAKLMGWVQDALPGLATNLGLAAGTLLSWIAQLLIDVVPKLAVLAVKFVGWVATDVIPALPGVLATIASALWTFITTTADTAGPKLTELAQKFLDWVETDVIPYLSGKLDQINTSISDWVSGAAATARGYLVSVGTAIVGGIQDGITSAWGAFTTWISNQIAKIPAPVRAALGIDSPSKVMRDQVGKPIVDGIIVGIADRLPFLNRVLVDGLKDALGLARGTVEHNGAAIVAAMERMAQNVGNAAGKVADALYGGFAGRGPNWDTSGQEGTSYGVGFDPHRMVPAGYYDGETTYPSDPDRDARAKPANDMSAKAATTGRMGAQTFIESWARAMNALQPRMTESMSDTLNLLSRRSIIPWAEGMNERLELSAGFWMISIADGLSGNHAAIDAARAMGEAMARALAQGWGAPVLASPTIAGSPGGPPSTPQSPPFPTAPWSGGNRGGEMSAKSAGDTHVHFGNIDLRGSELSLDQVQDRIQRALKAAKDEDDWDNRSHGFLAQLHAQGIL